MVLLSETDAKNAIIFAERLRKKIERILVKYEQYEIKFTVSLGIYQLVETTKSAQQWLEGADQALYQSKENGRNKTSVFNSRKSAS